MLGIEPEHLDVHNDFEDYLNAKANIRRFQHMDDVCLYHPTNKYAHIVAATPLVNAPVVDREYGGSIEFAKRYAIADDDQVYVDQGSFCVQERIICSTDHLKIPGRHNIENACAAMSAVSELWLGVTDEQYAQGLENFTGLPHRLKYVRTVDGVDYYDDSIATTPGSTIAAINAFERQKVLLLGGSDKGADYTELVDKILVDTTVRSVITMGATGEKIADIFEQKGVGRTVNRAPVGATMDKVVEMARATAQSGDVVILSPASASFDMFKNYADRGDQFIAAVRNV